MKRDKHPYQTFTPKNMKMLILGSIPPARFTRDDLPLKGEDIDFYYGSSDNYLWEIIADINDLSLQTGDEIRDFLEFRKIGITDIVERCNRESTKRGHPSASDSMLADIEYRNLDDILSCNTLETILCTSRYVEKGLRKNYQLNNCTGFENRVQISAIPSPSGNGSRGIGRDPRYKKIKSKSTSKFDTIDFRKLIYSEHLRF